MHLRQPLVIAFIFFIAVPSAFAQTFKIATLSPEGSMWMENMREGALRVAEQTRNRVQFKFYPGGVMGNDKAVLRKIRIGQLQGGAVVAGSLSAYFPGNQIYSQPMRFKSQEEVDYVRKEMDSFILQGLEDAGFVILGLTGGGFAYIMSKEPIETVADLKSRKVWIPDNDKLSQNAVSIFGITPIPLPISDVRTSLASGLIDTVTISAVGAIVLQWHTEIKYVTNLPLLYIQAVLAIDKKRFDRISPEDQQIVRTVMGTAFDKIDASNRKDDIKAMAALKKQGITFITPTGKNLDDWIQVANKASDEMVTSGAIPKEAAHKVELLLKDYRSKHQEHAQ